MRAAILQAAGQPLEIKEDVLLDDPASGQVRVRVAACGVCHSDLSMVDGAFPCPVPIVLGHEAAGVVDAVGVIGRFGSQPGSIIKSRADLEGPDGCLDLTINITDVLAAITGFQGLDYPFEPTADDPCDSTCGNPLP